MVKQFLTTCYILLCGVISAQSPIPDPEVNAIKRLVNTEIVYNSTASAVETTTEITTLLNISAENKARFGCSVDWTRTLKSFSGTITDADGNIIRKLKRSDLKYTELSSGLATDGAFYFFSFTPASYPCTFSIKYEIACKDGILGFPPFAPLYETGTKLEQSSYKLTVPRGTAIYYKNLNTDIRPEIQTTDKHDIYLWTMPQVSIIRDEIASPPPTELLPMVYIVPGKFVFEGTSGEMKSWDTFGRWLWNLWAGRDVLPDELRAEVHRRTDSLQTDLEKIQTLYDYLAKTTRYVSIQLGIGGLRTMTAAEVYRTKFGDCKALTNYMMSMLKECGIPSNFTIIHTKNRRMLHDFASAGQANHAILRVPLATDTLWLECTNPELPMGYVHTQIAGHDAVYFADSSGHFTTLPRYADSLNVQTRLINVTIEENGSAEAAVHEISRVNCYEQRLRLFHADTRLRAKMLQRENSLHTTTIDSISVTEHKSPLPSMDISYQLKTPQYGNSTGKRCFIPLNPFSDTDRIRDKRREYDLYFPFGCVEQTTITLHLPQNMQLETLPPDRRFETLFGSFTTHVVSEGNTIRIEVRYNLRSGTFSKDLFEQYRNFIDSFTDACKANIVLKRTE